MLNTTQIIDPRPSLRVREYHIDITLNGDSPRAYSVVSIDAMRAETLLRNRFAHDTTVRTFRIDMLREIGTEWVSGQYQDAVFVSVPRWLEPRLKPACRECGRPSYDADSLCSTCA